MSQDKRHHHAFIDQTVRHVDKHPKELLPVIQDFKAMVENDSRLYMLFSSMFDQVPHNKKYLKDPVGEKATIRDFHHLLKVLNHVLTTAPAWTDAGHSVGLVGVPINAILDWPMGTRAGFAVFQDPQVNAMLKKVLDAWGQYLSSEESASVLGDDTCGWFSEHGLKALEEVANLGGETSYKFDELFQCDPKAKYYGYKSWDDYFTRLFRDGVRPVAEPENDNIIINACESMTYKVAHNIHRRDKFWIKGQPYSCIDMFAQDPLAEQFVGGTVYQAFLSALSYHRWHVPVSGTVKKVTILPGTYYSEPLYEDFAQGDGPSAEGENTSQEYLSVVATRAIIYIEADNPKIGLMAFIAIGMTEVSTCEVYLKEGQKVKKGDLSGAFHFGGSSHVQVFRKGVQLKGFPEPGRKYNVPVRSKLCEVVYDLGRPTLQSIAFYFTNNDLFNVNKQRSTSQSPTMASLSMYSIWLCPSPAQSLPFQHEIDELAKKYQPAPTFSPHITFYSGIDTSVPLDQVKGKLKIGLQRWTKECELAGEQGVEDPLLQLDLDLPTAGTFFFQAIIQPVTQNITVPEQPSLAVPDTTLGADSPKRTGYEALLRGRQILEEVFEKKPAKPFYPHLSLMYSERAQDELQRIVDSEFSVEGVEKGKMESFGEVECARVTVVACVGKTEDWKEVARFDLAGNEVEQ
ncbi:hypothetical protein QFC22_005105 [Naganishia vaughanmartiniae]|uniref:Uncharacterized protein n=1 Tax=Naganishia vaughanmartiniae TaxID=1424756 RepID=A0ACC2WY51_9TREE|nr:hypothetical protein QFC22_005105 [Naganishia vaughanmartiniae]